MEIQVSAESSVQQHALVQATENVFVLVPEGVEAFVTLLLEPSMQQATLQVTVSKQASLTLFCMQPAGVVQTITQRNTVEEGATLHCQNITLGAKTSHSIETELQGAQATSSVDWMSYAKAKEEQLLSATNMFTAPNGRGEMTIKSVVEDTANITCNGLIDIGLNGGGTDTYLTEDVLMLDPTCVVDAIPGLEIKTNDVKASHSATVSQVTKEDIFYFQARGIAPLEAKEMYVTGFLGALLARVPNEELRSMVREAVTQKYRSLR